MWPNSPFARPVSSFERPVALVLVDPCDKPDVAIYVRHEWIPYIVGALKQLVLQTTWDTTDPDALWLVQQRAMTLLSCVGTSTEPEDCKPPIAESDYEMAICEQLRFQNGKLQGLCCNVWTDIEGQPSQGIGGGSQPGEGTPQPTSGGGTICYQGELDASSLWLAPVVVSDGDVLELTEAKGAGTDGAYGTWNCPDGSAFFAGACTGYGHTSGSDPLPSVNHMRLIWNIDGVFYDAMSGPITVVAGVSNGQAILQVNDDVLTDNHGTYQIKACVTNNQAAPWTALFNFALNSYASLFNIADGLWVAGQGYNGVNASGLDLSFVAMTLIPTSVAVGTMSMQYDCPAHSGSHAVVAFYSGAGGYIGGSTSPTDGTNVPYTVPVNANVNQPGLQLNSGTSSGPVNVRSLTITGSGLKPAGWP